MDFRVLLLLVVSGCLGSKDKQECSKCQPIRPMKDFDEDKFLGQWYETRWYPGEAFSVSIDQWDYNIFFSKKPEEKKTIFYDITFREKDTAYCVPTVNFKMTEIRPGQYWTSDGIFMDNFTTTILYTDYDNMAVSCKCFEDLEGNCKAVVASFWFRAKKMRQCDVRKAEMVIEDTCKFDMNKFIDIKHEVDCAPLGPKTCS